MALKWTTNDYHIILSLVSVICAVFFQGVTCQGVHGRGDDSLSVNPLKVPGTHKPQLIVYPSLPARIEQTEATKSNTLAPPMDQRLPHTATEDAVTHDTQVACVAEAAVRNKDGVRLKLKNISKCEENKANILSVFEHLCDNDNKIQIYQQDNTDEMILSGKCIEDDPKGMTDKFNNDNIKDKVGVLETETVLVNHSRAVLISVLLTGLLIAALLIAVYILKTHYRQTKGKFLKEEMFQEDEPNQGNTLLSVAPLPPQEPVEKLTSNGESLDSSPTNGHSATQTPVADTEM